MSYTWKLDYTHNDLTINSSVVLETITGTQEVKQRVVIALKHFYGEYFLNTEHGVPYKEAILGFKDLGLAESLLRSEILSVPGVISIETFKLSYFARSITVNVVFLAQGSEINVESVTYTTEV